MKTGGTIVYFLGDSKFNYEGIFITQRTESDKSSKKKKNRSQKSSCLYYIEPYLKNPK